MYKNIEEAAQYIQSQISHQPDIAIILGSGLGGLKNEVDIDLKISYQDIPHFLKSTVAGHSGELIFGYFQGKKILMMSGRFHYYEGYDMKQITFPIRVFKKLGIDKLIVSNASGGVNKAFAPGDVMLIRDHINFFPENPLRGKNLDEFGPRFPDMSEPYDLKFLQGLKLVAAERNIPVFEGVYLGLQGPTFETPAEYGMVQRLGADAVGMSTVPEVIVAKHQGMRVAAISVITDMGGPDLKVPVSHEEVLNAANVAMPKVISLVSGFLKNLDQF